jgi:hypothetical protein
VSLSGDAVIYIKQYHSTYKQFIYEAKKRHDKKEQVQQPQPE